MQLFVITLAAFVPDFDSAIGILRAIPFRLSSLKHSKGIPSIFALAQQFGTTVSEINNLTSKYALLPSSPAFELNNFCLN